jgi:hypothetical protein
MRKLIIAAAALIAAYSFLPSQARAQVLPTPVPGVHLFWHTWVPWVAFGCPASIMLSAAVAGNKDGRELTYWEAYTCGLLYWFGKPPPKYVRKIKHSWLIEAEPVARRVG